MPRWTRLPTERSRHPLVGRHSVGSGPGLAVPLSHRPSGGRLPAQPSIPNTVPSSFASQGIDNQMAADHWLQATIRPAPSRVMAATARSATSARASAECAVHPSGSRRDAVGRGRNPLDHLSPVAWLCAAAAFRQGRHAIFRTVLRALCHHKSEKGRPAGPRLNTRGSPDQAHPSQSHPWRARPVVFGRCCCGTTAASSRPSPTGRCFDQAWLGPTVSERAVGSARSCVHRSTKTLQAWALPISCVLFCRGHTSCAVCQAPATCSRRPPDGRLHQRVVGH